MTLAFLVEWVGILIYLEDCRKSLSFSLISKMGSAYCKIDFIWSFQTGVFHQVLVLIRMDHQMFLALSQVALSGTMMHISCRLVLDEILFFPSSVYLLDVNTKLIEQGLISKSLFWCLMPLSLKN